VICHNANCASPDVTRDDTIATLTESLALARSGVPVLDGMEFDTFWYGADSRCLFAHDLVNDTSTPASAAAGVIADYLAGTTRASWNGERFYVFIEMKPQVGPSYSDAHTPQQYIDHAECALDAVDQILVGARAGGHATTFGFVTGDPTQLEVLAARPRWTSLEADPDVELLQIGDIFAPYSSVVPTIADYTHIDAVEYHPDFMTLEHRETYRSLDIDLVQWSLVTTTEALAAIDQWEPRFAVTNEAMLVRRWAEN
jgi:hypothetical protein